MTDIIPAAYRRAAYRISAAVGLLLGATQVGYASADAGQPTWLTVALAVYAFLAAGLGLVAGANVVAGGRDEDGRATPRVAVLGLTLLTVAALTLLLVPTTTDAAPARTPHRVVSGCC